MADYSQLMLMTWGITLAPQKLQLYGLALLLGILLCAALTPLVMRIARRAGVIDHPHSRRVHSEPTPRWGGLAMLVAFLVTLLLLTPVRSYFGLGEMLTRPIIGILLGAVLMTAVGAIDDKWGLPAKVKLLGQIVAASVLPLFGNRVMVIFDINLLPSSPHWIFDPIFLVSAAITILWVVIVTNAINLIDGVDGLAAGIVAIAAFTFIVIGIQKGTLGEAMMATALLGVCLGFLYYNFHPAKIFMGDAGSHFLGFLLAALSIYKNWKVATGVALAVPLLILAVPLFDAAFAVCRRALRGRPIFSADKEHLHHRLLDMGLNQRAVVIAIYVLTAIGCALAVILTRSRLWE